MSKSKLIVILSFMVILLVTGFGIFRYKNMPSKTVEVFSQQDFDTSKVGVYIKKYGSGFLTRRQRIYIKDTTSPVIKLNGKKDVYVCPNSDYHDEGYEVVDNYDKNIKVKVTVNKNKIIYEAKDSSNNKTKVIRNINQKDIEKPHIEASDNINIRKGEDLTKFKVSDNCDGDITQKAEVLSFDKNKLGKQEITIKVKDKALNESEKKINVYVYDGLKRGVIYLTFDDGPRDGPTDKLLDILKREKIKVTFFVTGNGNPNLIKRAYNEGHEIGIHTFSHRYNEVYQNFDGFKRDFDKIDNIVYDMTGKRTKYYRFPGGSSNTISRKYQRGIVSQIALWLKNNGYTYYDWNISSGDADGKKHTAVEIANNVIRGLNKGRENVVLYHDIYMSSVDSVPMVIEFARNNGYVFELIDHSSGVVHHKILN